MERYEKKVLDRFDEMGISLLISFEVSVPEDGAPIPDELVARISALHDKWSDEIATVLSFVVCDYIREVEL